MTTEVWTVWATREIKAIRQALDRLIVAQGIEAASAAKTTQIGLAEGESPVRDSECAHNASPPHQGNDDD